MGRTVGRLAGSASLIAVALVACGSHARLSRADYQRDVGLIGKQFNTTLQKIFTSPELQNPSSLKQAAGVIRQGASAIDDAASQLGKLRPPGDADAAHTKLVQGFHELADELRDFAAAADAGDVAKVKQFDDQATNNALPGESLIQQALAELQSLGYKVGGT